ncbi:BatA domain-containing protein [Maribacter sp. TH_r10]|uniref:BatA domain-containing protein n=1 Tax=Maribacter sp. TH_r10 TaxID=3082086 RepID=UPI0029537AE2|nr:BatA domain-containing protein [Maribacter sp. TH_r10]MDV7140475.1 BatA domain-containing protein [Maribacter sp. TH_r10]
MQFKYPELLWAFFLLLIPIFIHLFQLRRFKKTPFTNVKLLQKIVSESRKSNSLKKWLLLCTRLLLYAALILAFARPFLANTKALLTKETVIYLDNSFSMWAKHLDETLMNNAVQDILKSVPPESTFSLFTNTNEYKDIRLVDVQNELLRIIPTPNQLSLEEIELKAGTFFSKNRGTIKNLIIVSDFQNRISLKSYTTDSTLQKHLVKIPVTDLENITIDSCYVSKSGIDIIDITALFSASPDVERTPVSLYNNDKLIAKTAALFNNGKSEATFTLPASEVVSGKLVITDKGLPYDNHLYFNIDEKDRPKVLAIEKTPSNYLQRIYSEDEFVFSSYSLKNLNYRDIENQNLIILNELQNIPNSLISSIQSFVADGGSLTIIPAINADINSYNQLLGPLSLGTITEGVKSENLITQITFGHPLYEGVFEKSIDNFQYPKVNQFYKLKSNTQQALTYQNGEAFLVGSNGVYLFTAALTIENSNFQQSPLIVPTFLKMGTNSLQPPPLYFVMNGSVNMDVSRKMAKDHILKVSKGDQEFIPQQKTLANKVSLSFIDNPTEDGVYTISENMTPLKKISFNYPRDESDLGFMDLNQVDPASIHNSITTLFQELKDDNRITELWKWFVILALFFLLIEVLIIKFFK